MKQKHIWLWEAMINLAVGLAACFVAAGVLVPYAIAAGPVRSLPPSGAVYAPWWAYLVMAICVCAAIVIAQALYEPRRKQKR